MATIEQLTAQAHKLPPSTPLHEQVAKYSGNPHQLLLALLKNPDKPILSILEQIGCAIGSYYRWRGSLADYAATVDAIREGKESLRRTAALAILEARTVPIAEAMANRAEGMGRDAQRAGERILEAVGVLQKEPMQVAVVDPTRELVIELRRQMSIAMGVSQMTIEALPEPEAAERALAKVLGPGKVLVEDETGVGKPT